MHSHAHPTHILRPTPKVEREMAGLDRLLELRRLHAGGFAMADPLPGAAGEALLALRAPSVPAVALALSDSVRAPPVTDHSCECRALRAHESTPALVYRAKDAPFNSACPISLADFEEGEVRRVLLIY